MALNLTEFYGLSVIAIPFWRIAVRGIDIFEGDREMNVEQIKVIDPPEVELIPCQLGYMFGSMEGVPKLCGVGELNKTSEFTL
jgi:hypothetical protein